MPAAVFVIFYVMNIPKGSKERYNALIISNKINFNRKWPIEYTIEPFQLKIHIIYIQIVVYFFVIPCLSHLC